MASPATLTHPLQRSGHRRHTRQPTRASRHPRAALLPSYTCIHCSALSCACRTEIMSRSPTDDALLPAAAARGCLLCLLVRNARAGQGAAGIGAPIQVASCMHAHRGTASIWHCGCGACAMLSAIALRLVDLWARIYTVWLGPTVSSFHCHGKHACP